jgi:hypothetical protein
MKEKRIILSLLFLLLALVIIILPLIIAEDETIDKSYACLKSKLGDDCGNTRNTLEASFSLLAMSYDSSVSNDCKLSLKNKKKNNCWGDSDTSSCNIKASSIAAISLKHIGVDVDDSVNYLLSTKKIAKELEWFIQIDTNNVSECDINGKKITINKDKKILGTPATGLTKGYNDYWLKIMDTEKNYTISCDTNFITAIIYKKPESNTYYVSSETHSSAAFDSTLEKVDSYCFSNTASCDYESSLWAVLALKLSGKDVSKFIPYISAMADNPENKKYLPYAFLYLLVSNSQDYYYTELINLQKQNKYWDESNKKLYDSAVVLLALSGINLDPIISSKNYLLSLRGEDYCWPNVLDTAFLLHAAWPKSAVFSGGEDGETFNDCETYGHFCTIPSECTLQNSLDNFRCPSSGYVCCNVLPRRETCEEKQGIVCEENKKCSGTEIIASDTNYCCLAACQDIVEEISCEERDYVCKDSCENGDTEKPSYYCDFQRVCCSEKKTTGINWFFIIILIILILALLFAIIYRNSLKLWLFKIKNQVKFKPGPKQITRPNLPPLGFQQPFPAMFKKTTQLPPQYKRSPGPQYRQNQRTGSGSQKEVNKDKEFEDTMRKLREMSK